MPHSKNNLVLRIRNDQWSFHRTDAMEAPLAEIKPPANSATPNTESLKEVVHEHGLMDCPAVVALGSELCFPCSFNVPSPKQARQRESLKYQTEDLLPFSAEEIACDFAVDGTSVFAVCCYKQWVEDVLDKLAKADVQVRCVAPEALLASGGLRLKGILDRTGHDPDPRCESWVSTEGVDHILVNRGKTCSWRRTPTEKEAIEQSERLLELSSDQQTTPFVIGPPDLLNDENKPTLQWIQDERDPSEAGLSVASDRIIEGGVSAEIDLLRSRDLSGFRFNDPLVHERVFLKASLLLALLLATVWNLASAQRSAALVGRIESQQSDLFRTTFPEQRIPRGVRARLQSELRKISGTRGGAQDAPEHRDSVLLLQQLLQNLPTDLRYRVLELRIDRGRLYLVGEARTHGDADRIAAALRRTGLSVTPPSTQQLAEKGIEFRLAATISGTPDGGGA